MLVLLVDELLLLFEDFETLFVGGGTLGGVHLEFDLVVQFLGDAGENGLECVDLGGHLALLTLGVHKCVGQDEKSGWDTVLQTQFQPCLEIIAESGRRNTISAKSTAGAGRLELWNRQRADAFERDGTVITLDLAHADADLVAQEVVSAERGEVEVAADGDKLRTRQVVKRQIVLEDLRNLDDFLR